MDYTLLLLGNRQVKPTLTRAQVCSLKLTFQGLNISTQQFGPNQPWFEPAYQCLTNAQDRASVRAQKKAAGDTHLILEFFTNQQSIYDESGQPWQQAVSPSGEQNPTWFRDLVSEVIYDGLIPVVVFDGDDGDNAEGYPNALRQLPILVPLLEGLTDCVLFARFWDGVFYGSSPANIQNFGQQFRKLLPNGYLAIEHQPGKIPVGNGPGDYQPNGMMVDYDVICAEFQDGALHQDSTWQVAGRMLGPAYKRPPEQPSGDDPSPPWYLAGGNARGPYFAVAFEYYAYEFVRSSVSQATVQGDRNYLQSLGYTLVC